VPLTNKYGAPDVFIRAVEGDPYSKGDADFSATELLKPPQIVRLYNEHGDKVVTDVRDEWWKLLGKGVHNILEEHGQGQTEERFFADCNGSVISGAIDLLDDGAVTDYKVTSVYTIQRGLKSEWEQQLNIYAWLLRQNGMAATKLTIVGLCRDWQLSRANLKKDYPQSPIVPISVPLWSDRRQDDFVAQRVRVHTMDNTLPCTPEERWARGGYTVFSGRLKPKTFDTMQEAAAFIQSKQKPGVHYSIKEGAAKFIRCESWCPVSDYCPQWNGEGR
tara:strand:+ start:14749 stop:15573 length:825 start_codon:yes stop_codon:yes gene_type:complete